MKYFIYCRKSSEEDSKQLQSLDTQKRILLDYAKLHNLEVVGDPIEEKRSAKTEGNRPQFLFMIEKIKQGIADAILVVDPDRLTRNLSEGDLLIKMFSKGQLKEIRTRNMVYASLESMNSLIDEIASATKYSIKLSIKVKDGNASKLLKGEYPSYAPLGYTNKDKRIFPDPIYAPYITLAFQLYVTGQYSLKSLANCLYEKGLRTRTAHKKVKKSVIARVLRNPEYFGVIQRKGNIYTGIHEPLIDKATFDIVQDVLTGKSTGKKQTHDFLYRPYLSCETCSCRMTASIKKGRYIYYYCTNGKGNCNEHKIYLSQSDIKDLLCEVFADFTLDRVRADLSFSLYEQDLLSTYNFNSSASSTIEQRLVKVKEDQKQLLSLLFDKKITQELFDDKNKQLEIERINLEVQLKTVKPKDPVITLEQVRKIKEDACNLVTMFDDGDDIVREDLLKAVLWNFSIKEQKGASVKYKSPYKYLQNLNKTSDLSIWRARWDDFRTANWLQIVKYPDQILQYLSDMNLSYST
jgi:DNA invertase Pin-like site-specific DNA recombinase